MASENLPKYVQRRKRDGVLLFRKRAGKSIREVRLETQFPAGAKAPECLQSEVDELLKGVPDERLAYRAPKPVNRRPLRGDDAIFATMQKSARSRAKKYGFEYKLPDGWCEQAFEAQDGKCAVSLIPFRIDRSKRSPFMPSLDRIDPSKGYHPSNCRLVAYIVNCALNQFGEDALTEMSRAIVAKDLAP